MNEPLSIVRTSEEMLEYIADLNRKIIAGLDVPDSDITRAIKYQRDLNQHNLASKPRRGAVKEKLKESLKKLNLEDL